MCAAQRLWFITGVTVLGAGVGIASLAGCALNKNLADPVQVAPSRSAADARQDANLVKQGKKLFDRTPELASRYVGNQLSCVQCHIDNGKADYAAPLIGAAGLFPMFSQRAGRQITLQDRIDECFVRSEAGRPLPPASNEMQALVAYIRSLSTDRHHGRPYAQRGLVKLPALKGDPDRGRIVYRQCALCHGSDGAGMPPVIPPLWGRGSFNDGAGMNQPAKMSAYVYANMPQGSPGFLTAQQAYDVAAFIHRKPRPKFNPAYAHF